MLTVLLILIVLAIVAALVYPGELSQLHPALNRWLYERAAKGYERKWERNAYRDAGADRFLTDFGREALERSGVYRVLDLGCGTGRGIRLLARTLPTHTRFTAVDHSPRMLEMCEQRLREQELADRVALVQRDLGDWARDDEVDETFGLVLLLETGEFLPEFARVIHRIAAIVAPGGGLILTRPAGLWQLFFPGRSQSAAAIETLLTSAGFDKPERRQWRGRYELLRARKRP